MKIFISGGAKNGKSYHAQCLAKAQATGILYYIATMAPRDDEDRERVERHRRERDGWGFDTVEQSHDIAEIMSRCDTSASFLLDSTTALLSNEMFSAQGEIDHAAPQKIARELELILAGINNIVIVSDYIFSDCIIYDADSEAYRRGLAYLDRICAQNCDIVLEVSSGNIMIHKGRELFQHLANQSVL